MHANLERIGVTNLHLCECQMNFLCVLRYILCPIGNSDFQDHITRQNVEGVLEGHLVARRSNEVTCPCQPMTEP